MLMSKFINGQVLPTWGKVKWGKSKWGKSKTHLFAMWRGWWRNQGAHSYLKATILLALSPLTAPLLWNAAHAPACDLNRQL